VVKKKPLKPKSPIHPKPQTLSQKRNYFSSSLGVATYKITPFMEQPPWTKAYSAYSKAIESSEATIIYRLQIPIPC